MTGPPDEHALELLRARSGLSIDAEGRFLHRGEPITHARTLEVLWRSLARAADGRYEVAIGRERAFVAVPFVDVVDAPYTVLGIVDRADGSPLLVLSDGSREPLDPSSVRVGRDGVLRCAVKGGHAARCSRSAQVGLGLALDEDPPGSGRYTLRVNGRAYRVADA